MPIYFSVNKDEVMDENNFHPGTFDNKYVFSSAELILHFRIFFTDFSFVTADPDYPLDGRRFMHGSIVEALNLVLRPDVLKTKLSVLLMRSDSDKDEYIATEIVKVIQAKDSGDNIAYIISCKNNKKYIEANASIKESELQSYRIVYRNDEN